MSTPENTPPGPMEITPETGHMNVHGYHPDVLSAIAAAWKRYQQDGAEASGAVGPVLLPYHAALLDMAKAFLDRDEHRVAVVMAQTAVEVLVEQVLTERLQVRATAPELIEWILDRAKPFTLTGAASRSLYTALMGDAIQQAPFWPRYLEHVTRRHAVVHRGEPMPRPAAEASLVVVQEIIWHLEQRRGL